MQNRAEGEGREERKREEAIHGAKEMCFKVKEIHIVGKQNCLPLNTRNPYKNNKQKVWLNHDNPFLFICIRTSDVNDPITKHSSRSDLLQKKARKLFTKS